MPAPFAAIEASVNQRAIGMLANAEADFGGGLVVSGVFDSAPQVVFDLVQGNNPQFRCLSSAVGTVDQDEAVSINGTAYLVSKIERDASGMAYLDLMAA